MMDTNPQPMAQPATPVAPQPKKNTTGLIVTVSILAFLFVILPLIALSSLYAFFQTSEGKQFINKIADEIDNSINENLVVGTWDCKNYSSMSPSYGSAGDFVSTLELNKDGTFRYGEYGDLANNRFAGNYTYTEETSKNEDYHSSKDGTWYMLKFSNVTLRKDGETQSTEGLVDLEMVISKTSSGLYSREAFAAFANLNMYYCYAD